MFQSYTQPLVVMLSILMAAIGAWAAVTITDKPLSDPVMLGILILIGYVVNPGIILVDHVNRLRDEGYAARDSLVQAGKDRLRPILMTAFSTTLGFLPMALNIGQSSDLWSPLAVTIIGGIISSTFLTLFILPSFILLSEDVTRFIKARFQAIVSRGDIGNTAKGIT